MKKNNKNDCQNDDRSKIKCFQCNALLDLSYLNKRCPRCNAAIRENLCDKCKKCN